ncbi:hypothetical protein M0805_002152 [Coniferiporia weirii]|nr:hypothetical protein M0805_002152 [Coniferiporia weirii]
MSTSTQSLQSNTPQPYGKATSPSHPHSHMPTSADRVPALIRPNADSTDLSSTPVSSTSRVNGNDDAGAQSDSASRAWGFDSSEGVPTTDSASNVSVLPKGDDSNTQTPEAGGASRSGFLAAKSGGARSQSSVGSEQSKNTQTPSKNQGKNKAGEPDQNEIMMNTAPKEGGMEPKEGKGDSGAPPEPEGGYPEQLHAGRLTGVGPEYGKQSKPTISERVQGAKETIKGTLKRDKDLKHTGKERMTGELKRKEHDEENNPTQGEEDKSGDEDKGDKDERKEGKDVKGESGKGDKDKGETKADDESKKMDTDQQGGEHFGTKTMTDDEAGTTGAPQTHATEKGREEQAASVRPEGAQTTQRERDARSNAAEAGVS